MAQLYTKGQIINGPELKTSKAKKMYLRFTLREWIGYGEYLHPQYTEVVAWGELAKQLHEAELTSGSTIWVSGSLELESYIQKDGVTRNKRLKLRLKEWGRVLENTDSQKKRGEPRAPSNQIPILDGERESLPK